MIRTHLLDPANRGKELHYYISSGGNAGLGAVTAALDLGCQCSVVVPLTTKPMIIEKLKEAGATQVIQHGASWFEADIHLRETFINAGEKNGVTNIYVPPFDHPAVWDGNATLISELAAQLPPREKKDDCRFPADVIVCSIGGGGLFNGIVQGLHAHYQEHASTSQDTKPVDVLAVETQGAKSLAYSLEEGELRALSAITSQATSLGAVLVARRTFENAHSPPAGVKVTSVVASDAEAARGVVMFADTTRMLVELACGVCVDVALGKRLRDAVGDLGPDSRVVIIVCGGSNITPEMVAEYREKLKNGWA